MDERPLNDETSTTIRSLWTGIETRLEVNKVLHLDISQYQTYFKPFKHDVFLPVQMYKPSDR